MARSVQDASNFCVPTALSYLTGMKRETIVQWLTIERTRHYSGKASIKNGWEATVYIGFLRRRCTETVTMGEGRNGQENTCSVLFSEQSPLRNGTYLISGSAGRGGHCYLVHNGKIYDNNTFGSPVETVGRNYRVRAYWPVTASKFNIDNTQKVAA